ncbi:hypothetical protein OS21_23000 [Dickeya oryzae]
MSNRFDTLIDWQACTQEEQRRLLTRPAISASDRISTIVGEILAAVRKDGDTALRDYSARFDKVQVDSLRVSAEAIDAAVARLGDDIKQAMATAVRNIETFHNAQKTSANQRRNPTRRTLPTSNPAYCQRRVVYSGWVCPAALHGADAGNPSSHRRVPACDSVLSATNCR